MLSASGLFFVWRDATIGYTLKANGTKPAITVNLSRILPVSSFDDCWYRFLIVATSSCFSVLEMPPRKWLPPEYSAIFYLRQQLTLSAFWVKQCAGKPS